MKKYHVATGDGKAYYGVNYESYREAKGILEFSQKRDPQAHIVEEEYNFTNADRIRAMSEEELAALFVKAPLCRAEGTRADCKSTKSCFECLKDWLQQPAEEV